MTDSRYAGVRAQLQNLGAIKEGANVRIQEKTIWDTILIPANTALTTTELFKNGNKASQYNNFQFPDTANGYLFQYGRVRHNLQFTVASAAQQDYFADYFNTFSTINWVASNIVVPPYTVGQMNPVELYQNYDETAATAGFQNVVKQKTWDWYEFADPIVTGAGDQISVQFVPAASLTTIAAFAAATTPYAPFNGVNANCYIRFEYTGYMYSEIK